MSYGYRKDLKIIKAKNGYIIVKEYVDRAGYDEYAFENIDNLVLFLKENLENIFEPKKEGE